MDHVRFHSCRPYIRASTDALIQPPGILTYVKRLLFYTQVLIHFCHSGITIVTSNAPVVTVTPKILLIRMGLNTFSSAAYGFQNVSTDAGRSSSSLSTGEVVVATAVVCVVCSFTAGLLVGVLLTQCVGVCGRRRKRGQTVYEDITLEKTPAIQLQTNEAYGPVSHT